MDRVRKKEPCSSTKKRTVTHRANREEDRPISADVNAVYVQERLQFYTNTIAQQSLFQPNGKRILTILLKNAYPDNSLYTMAYRSLVYVRRTYFEWYILLLEMDTNFTRAIYGVNFMPVVYSMFSSNQKVRWAFKRLLGLWLRRQCLKKRIGYEKDLVTQESVPVDDTIEVLCMKSRCIYCFSGNTLLKSICSNLEMQVNAIPIVTLPKNPYTNILFEYGEMLHIYNECLKWCAKKSKAFPIVLSIYRQSIFRIRTVANIHRLYFQQKATMQYLTNDDIDGEFFLETLHECITYNRANILLVMKSIPTYCTIPVFRTWNTKLPNHPLLKQWKSFAADYWFYEQTHVFPRERWSSLDSVVREFHSLVRASAPYLKSMVKRDVVYRAPIQA